MGIIGLVGPGNDEQLDGDDALSPHLFGDPGSERPRPHLELGRHRGGQQHLVAHAVDLHRLEERPGGDLSRRRAGRQDCELEAQLEAGLEHQRRSGPGLDERADVRRREHPHAPTVVAAAAGLHDRDTAVAFGERDGVGRARRRTGGTVGIAGRVEHQELRHGDTRLGEAPTLVGLVGVQQRGDRRPHGHAPGLQSGEQAVIDVLVVEGDHVDRVRERVEGRGVGVVAEDGVGDHGGRTLVGR